MLNLSLIQFKLRVLYAIIMQIYFINEADKM